MSGLTWRRRYLVLAICCLSLFIVGLDATIVNVALPSIGRELHSPVSGLQWTIDAYSLVLASLLMLSGSTADRVGRRRTFQAGLALFTLGSLLCSLAPGLGWLVAFRMLQAVGGSMLNPVAMSIITNTFTEPRAGPGDRRVGWRVRAQHGDGTRARRCAGRRGGLAGGVLGEHSRGNRGARAHRPVRAGVEGAPAEAPGSVRATARDRPARVAHLRVIEGPAYGWESPRILFFLAVAVIALAVFVGYEPPPPGAAGRPQVLP